MGTRSRHGIAQNAAATAYIQHLFALERCQGLYPIQSKGIDLVQGPKFTVDIPPTVGKFGEFGEFGGVDIGGIHVTDCQANRRHKKTPPKRGFALSAGNQFLREPTTSISTRRFLARPSLVLLSATGCFSPLPSV